MKKKLISLLLATVFACSMSVSVFAEDISEEVSSQGTEETTMTEEAPLEETPNLEEPVIAEEPTEEEPTEEEPTEEESIVSEEVIIEEFIPTEEETVDSAEARAEAPIPSSSLSFSGGKANASGTASSLTGATSIRLAVYLQEFRSGVWYDLTSFSGSSSGTTVRVSGSYAVQSGKKYRTIAYATYTVNGSTQTKAESENKGGSTAP